ncbi:MAG: NAD-dependent epimerase/dehydratase family protein, partial [Opitutaceae bacterium]|nr:NAD-dependent epimerase/dehydratase family protein [Opitutaceae bacterium]
GHEWDAVVQWVGFVPEEIERDLALFRGRAKQYIFISSASAYQKPVTHYLITESTPLANPYWDYSRQKIACEERLLRAVREEGFPAVIVRPSLTYGDTLVPLVMNSWEKSWTAIDRMRRGLPLIVPGDGNSLWTITHNMDFAQGLVGLLGHAQATGHAFHITSDEVLTWNQIYQQTAEAAGVAAPEFVHIATDFIAACLPEQRGGLEGDKAVSVVFDNTKIKRFVPGFAAKMSYAEGIRRTVAWFDAEPQRRQIDTAANTAWDKLIVAYERGLAAARKDFSI